MDTFVSTAALRETPLGDIWLAADDVGLVCLALDQDDASFRQLVHRVTGVDAIAFNPAPLAEALVQLQAYLAGTLRRFSLPINWGTLSSFQQDALRHVAAIPYGTTQTYGDIATALGNPNAARAVGRANATNPIPIIIPCHRVVGSDQALHGYAYGLARKAWLLRLEGVPVPNQLTLL